MSNLINTYPVFESSQVLTSSQLNQVVSYLDQQDRLTRARLIGMGIVCGLDLSYDDSGDTQVTISRGTAITSEGFLVTLGECPCSYYRPYSLPEGVEYDPFDEADPSITLHELLREMPEDETGVVSLSDDPGFLADKFVLLFLETFDNDQKSCLGNTCDELGIDRIFTVRKLLISKEDLDELLEHSSNVGNLYPDKYELPNLVMPRTLFDPEADHSNDYTAFSEHHTDTLGSIFTAIFGVEDGDDGALFDSYEAYKPLLEHLYDFNNPFGTSSYSDLRSTWSSFLEGDTNYRGIQYFSDFMKDLILAYDEFRDTASQLMAECCPDMSLFPKHVMLGRAVVPNETPEEAVTYRHGFVQPPIYNHQKELMERAISLHKRMVAMVEQFNLERITNPDEQDLRITPSDEKNKPLSERSIPYYYDARVENPTVGGTLEQFWNFDRTKAMEPGSLPTIMGYENQSADQSSPLNPIETPLYYDLDSYPFLRIEGHIGKEQEEVISLINDIRSRFNLPFDTVALQLDPEAELLDIDYSCGFEDLQEEYTVARNTYCGFIRDLVELLNYMEGNQDTIFDDSDETAEDLKQIREIMDTLKELCVLMPECLDEFKFVEFQVAYKEMLERLLHFLLVDQELLNEIEINQEDADKDIPIINGLMQRISPPLMKIVDLLFYNTFLRLYYAFKRREYYLRQQTATFSNYLKKHQGLEHQAGVPKGGSFIVVYSSTEEPSVVADFSLPYLCCGTDRCVPMCDDDDSDFSFEIPPFARPDYAITTVDQPVEIGVSANDYGFAKGTPEVSLEKDESERGGKIEFDEHRGVIGYEPPAEFHGYDRFFYTLTYKETGAADRGRVTVLVKEPEVEDEPDEPVTECYPLADLICWVQKDTKTAYNILNRRHPNNTVPGDDTQAIATALRQSLNQTNVFSPAELDSMNVFALRLLLDCIQPNHPEISDEQLRNAIEDYQKTNCGDYVSPDAQPSLDVSLDALSDNDLRAVLTNRMDIQGVQDMDRAELEAQLNKTWRRNNFTRNELMLLERSTLDKLFNQRGLTFNEDEDLSVNLDRLLNR